MTKLLIASIGMAGSGKSELVKYLQAKYNWPKVYFGEATFDRLRADSLEINYANERIAREKIRQELGMSAYAILALPKIENFLKDNDVVILESLYSWDEYKIIKEKYNDSFKTIAIYASPTSRFKRLTKRINERPIRSYEEFKTRDYSELENLAKGAPIAMADFTIVNETGIKKLHNEIDKIIKKIYT